MGSHWRNSGDYRSRQAKVIKFTSAFDTKTQTNIPFEELKKQFFQAANSPNPKAALATLRETFNLVCPHCKKAGLSFSFGSQTPNGRINRIAGTDIPGNPAHLKTKAKETHARGCRGIVVPVEGHKVDDQKGYRIHLNLGTIPERDPRTQQLVERVPGGKLVVLDTDLKDREPLSVTKVEDLIKPMRSGKIEKLKDAVVIRGNRKIPWTEFMIPANGHAGEQNEAMAQFVQSYFKNNQNAHPVFINLDLGNCTVSLHQDDRGKTKSYFFPKTAPIFIPGYGNVVVRPELLVQNEHMFDKLHQLNLAQGEIFVLAEHVYVTKPYKSGNTHHLTLLLRNPDMMIEGNLENITAAAQKRHDKVHPPADLLTPSHP